ncbi:expressed unknown protein [Seminavis robusta]|uniref:Uncharacterized protein n=1 Tax=Seminavis robusta TaxID=568900 RepID=A0A9N8E5R9_9STRA|nr:expressed unknown protein [Seminavis robusta]|eukprot:Sro544_g163650.1 n/a (782) ;mRNA; r:24470-26898
MRQPSFLWQRVLLLCLLLAVPTYGQHSGVLDGLFQDWLQGRQNNNSDAGGNGTTVVPNGGNSSGTPGATAAANGTLPAAVGTTNGTVPVDVGAQSNETVPVAVSNDTVPVAISNDTVPVAVSNDTVPVAVSNDTVPVAVSNDTVPTDPPGTVPPASGANATATRPPGDDTTTTPPPSDTVPPTNGGNIGVTQPPAVATSVPSVDTTDMVYFTIDFGFPEGVARMPNASEVQDLICQTNLFIQGRVQNATQNTIVTEAFYVDWAFNNNPDTTAVNGSGAMPVSVSFASKNTIESTGGPAPGRAVSDAMQVGTAEIVDYLQNYVWNVQLPDSLFQNADSANFNDELGQPVPPGQLSTTTCPFDPSAETPVPVPSTTPFPSPFDPNSNVTRPPTAANVTAPAPAPNVTVARPPTFPPSPAEAPVPPGATRQEVYTKFVVSNLQGITQNSIINSSGLSAAWPVFVERVVTRTAAENGDTYTPGRRQLLKHNRRRLSVELEPGSAYIQDLTLNSSGCGEDTHPDSTCHDAIGAYNLLLRENERPGLAKNLYGIATVDAIEAGELQTVMKEETPDTPLYIGTLADPSSGMAPWLIVLIVLLCLLFLCCCLALIAWYLMQDRDRSGGKELEPYDEEGFAYDFLIPPHHKVQTEADDDIDESAATKNVDDDELFEDEDGVAVAQMVKDDDDENEVAPATIMEESDDDEAKEGDEDDSSEDDDEEQVNVSAEVEDEDEADDSGDSDAGDPELVPVSNDLEESESFNHDPEAENETEDEWDDEGGKKKEKK